ncbi:MAG TPA: asparagine--tRNA ligase, partial [Acidilobales archaeon]|nr:asparagine--tRNA ligase [Acidilobales archaeon]
MLIKNILKDEAVNTNVKLKGWVYRKRVVGGKVFIVLRDSSGIIQCVVDRGNVDNATWKNAEKITRESSCMIEGVVRKEPRAPTGYEVHVSKLEIVGLSDWFPIRGGEGVDYLLDNRHLWIRSRKIQAIMKIKHTVLQAGREYFNRNGWWEVTPPIITGSACESGATQFEINYFGQKAYLSQSAQLYLEALIYTLDKVWSLTPSFRAEKSRTRRHLAEYWHLEAEAAWYGMEDMMKVTEELVNYI